MKKAKPTKQAQSAPSLLKVLLVELLLRHWLVSLLAVSLVLSSMWLANTSHANRKLTAQWDSLRQAQQNEQIAWESLRLELTALSEADRISNLAKKQLGMIEVTTKNEKVITL